MGLSVCVHELLHHLASSPIAWRSRLHLVSVSDRNIHHALVLRLFHFHRYLDDLIPRKVETEAKRAQALLGDL